MLHLFTMWRLMLAMDVRATWKFWRAARREAARDLAGYRRELAAMDERLRA